MIPAPDGWEVQDGTNPDGQPRWLPVHFFVALPQQSLGGLSLAIHALVLRGGELVSHSGKLRRRFSP